MSYTSEFPPFYVTVDMVVLTGAGPATKVLLIRRGSPPYAGQLALPGGFVEPDESLDDAARRELHEETNVDLAEVELAQIGAYGEPGRDPRWRIVSVAYLALLPEPTTPTAGSDAMGAGWYRIADLAGEELAFDHATIIEDALSRV